MLAHKRKEKNVPTRLKIFDRINIPTFSTESAESR
jgi:hypothetical protein